MHERNLLLADWRDEHHEESMLHVRPGVWGAEMLKNLRRARPAALLPVPKPWMPKKLRGARPIAQPLQQVCCVYFIVSCVLVSAFKQVVTPPAGSLVGGSL